MHILAMCVYCLLYRVKVFLDVEQLERYKILLFSDVFLSMLVDELTSRECCGQK